MQDYDQYKNKQRQYESDADTKHETLGGAIHWIFVVIGVAISGGATFFLNHTGLANNPFYQKSIGAENAAWLAVFLLDGSLVGLLIGVTTFLKSSAQRTLAKAALTVIKIVLSLNVLAAFALLAGKGGTLTVPVQLYTQWGVPLCVAGAIWLWSELLVRRRKNVMMAAALDTVAERDKLWSQEYLADQERYRTTYQTVTGSDDMQRLRLAIAEDQAIKDIAKQSGITYDQAKQLYSQSQRQLNAPAQDHVTGQLLGSSTRPLPPLNGTDEDDPFRPRH